MNTIKRVAKNISVLFLSQIINFILGFFTLMYTARYLGVDGFGTLSFALAFTGIFSIFIDMGLNTLTIREIARNKSLTKDYIDNITLLKILLALINFTLILIILYFLGYNHNTIQVVSYIALYTIFIAFSQFFYAIFQAYEKMEYQSLGNILNSFLLLIVILVAINYGFNIIHFSFIYAIAGLLILFYSFFVFSWQFNVPKIRFGWDFWKSLIREAWPFAVTSISINLYLWIDTIILSLLKGQEAVGLYNASYKLILVLLFIPVVFNNAIFPLMSQYFVSSKESLRFTFDKLFKIMILIGLPISVITMIVANKIIILVYGYQFLGSVIALQILIWSTFFIFARSPLERLLESSNRQLSVTKIFIIGALFNSILNIILIPQFSYIGAAIITVLTDILVFGLLLFVVKRSTSIQISKNTKLSIVKIVLANFIMGLIVSQIVFLDLFVLISIGAIIYILEIFLLQIFDDDEILIMKSIFQRGN